jgi:hypothetical protein
MMSTTASRSRRLPLFQLVIATLESHFRDDGLGRSHPAAVLPPRDGRGSSP